MKKVQILYPLDTNNRVIDDFYDEASEMIKRGFIVNDKILSDIDLLIYRGSKIIKQEDCICHPKICQGWNEIIKTSYMHEYYPVIKDYSIPTVFTNILSEEILQNFLAQNNWTKVFIKSPSRSLFFLSEKASVWPDTSADELIENFAKRELTGPFAVRKFIDNPDIFYDEQRYWILNGNAYHPSNIVPPFVSHCGNLMYNFSKSRYFTIDVAGNYIVEVNPGESSDRGGDNPLAYFCDIFEKEFLKK